MTKSGSLNSRLAKWAILLSQYDMRFVPQKVVKGQALANFLAAHPVSENSKLHEDILDGIFKSNMISEDEVWQMFFDGASRTGPKVRSLLVWGLHLSHHKTMFFLRRFY